MDARRPPDWSQPFAGQYAHMHEGRGHRPFCVEEQHVWRVTVCEKPAAARECSLHQLEQVKTDIASNSLATRRPHKTWYVRTYAPEVVPQVHRTCNSRARPSTNKLTLEACVYVRNAASCATLRPESLGDEQVPFEDRRAAHLQQLPTSQSHRAERSRPTLLLCP